MRAPLFTGYELQFTIVVSHLERYLLLAYGLE